MPKKVDGDAWVHVNLYGLKQAAEIHIESTQERKNVAALIRMLLASHLGEDEPNVQQGRKRPAGV